MKGRSPTYLFVWKSQQSPRPGITPSQKRYLVSHIWQGIGSPREAAEESFRLYVHSEPLAKAIELLLIKLPDADAPVRAPRTPLPTRVRKLLAIEVDRLIDAYQAGAGVGELAAQFGSDTVSRAGMLAGAPVHPGSTPSRSTVPRSRTAATCRLAKLVPGSGSTPRTSDAG